MATRFEKALKFLALTPDDGREIYHDPADHDPADYDEPDDGVVDVRETTRSRSTTQRSTTQRTTPGREQEPALRHGSERPVAERAHTESSRARVEPDASRSSSRNARDRKRTERTERVTEERTTVAPRSSTLTGETKVVSRSNADDVAKKSTTPAAPGRPQQFRSARSKREDMNSNRSLVPVVVTPRQFDDVKDVAVNLKNGNAVSMDLSGVDKALRRRLVDFVSGLAFASDAKLDRIATPVYLVTPAESVVSDAERQKLLDR